MKFFHDAGQPAVRTAGVVMIDKGMYVGNKRNYSTIEFTVIDLDEAVRWRYDSEEDRDRAFEAVMSGLKLRKIV